VIENWNYKELVNAHAGINSDLSAKIALEFVLLHGFWGIVS
jgi:hypothetical protein